MSSSQFWTDTYRAVGPLDTSKDGGRGLRSLYGVALPTATAVLSILNPRVWPVIDRRALPRVLHGFPQHGAKRFDVYDRYTTRLAALAENRQESVHELDQWAYNPSEDRPWRWNAVAWADVVVPSYG